MCLQPLLLVDPTRTLDIFSSFGQMIFGFIYIIFFLPFPFGFCLFQINYFYYFPWKLGLESFPTHTINDYYLLTSIWKIQQQQIWYHLLQQQNTTATHLAAWEIGQIIQNNNKNPKWKWGKIELNWERKIVSVCRRPSEMIRSPAISTHD